MRSALILLAAFTLAGCSVGDACENIVASRVVAPDGQHAAVLFNRNCGAATGFSTQISILDAKARPEGKGNVFIADGEGGAGAASWGGPWAAMRWVAPGRVEIAYDPASRIFLREPRMDQVTIDWRPAAPPSGAVTP